MNIDSLVVAYARGSSVWSFVLDAMLGGLIGWFVTPYLRRWFTRRGR